ncbi:MAG: RsmD family RNA methyltransferase [Candidatus Saccharimonadales bacterium]
MKTFKNEVVTLNKIVGGGQALGTLEDGKKVFAWGGLPGETVTIQVTKKKSKYIEGVVTEVSEPSVERVEPRDPNSYLSTSPWQIMDFKAEQHYKAALIEEAFELHDIVLPAPITVYTDDVQYGYRNKVEFSWFGDTINSVETLDLAFFRRGTQGKITIEGSSLAPETLNNLGRTVRDILRTKKVQARDLKTIMIRCDQAGNAVFQLYVKEKALQPFAQADFEATGAQGGEVIYSDPKSPASVITKRLVSFGETRLTDTVLDVPFTYVCEGFFQGNIPVYEQALRDMQQWVEEKPVVDMYSGVGSIGFTIGGDRLTLVELNKNAVDEMKRNRYELGKKATIIEASAESSLEYIDGDSTIILDPPRAGLHAKVVERLLETKPQRIIYLSCNPVTQARDVALLAENYGVRHHQGYNFFPRTPHIEHLVILDLKPAA